MTLGIYGNLLKFMKLKEHLLLLEFEDVENDYLVAEYESVEEFFDALDRDEFEQTENVDNPFFRIFIEGDYGDSISEKAVIVEIDESYLDEVQAELENYPDEEFILDHLENFINLVDLYENLDCVILSTQTDEDVSEKVISISNQLLEFSLDLNMNYDFDDSDLFEEEEPDEFSKKGLLQKIRDKRRTPIRRASSGERAKLKKQYKRSMRKKKSQPKRRRLGLKDYFVEMGLLKDKGEFEETYKPTKGGGLKLMKDAVRLYKDVELAKQKLKASYNSSLNSLGELGERMKEKKGELTPKDKFNIRAKNKRNPKHYRNNPFYWALVALKAKLAGQDEDASEED
jgi:hypothetical protein